VNSGGVTWSDPAAVATTGSIHEPIQAGASTDREAVLGAQLCGGATDRAVGNAARKIQTWKTEERECVSGGERRGEGTECFPTAQGESRRG
jgi:hypothetical protein